MAASGFQGLFLTYDDVLLVPSYADILPKEVSLATKVTRNISLAIPFLSAAMDTVTESSLAISLAREGGMGILHKNMSIEQQANEVRRVKRSESGMITDPITLEPEMTLKEALAVFSLHSIGGCPVVDATNTLVGILTNRDLYFEDDLSRKVSDIMTKDGLVTIDHRVDLDEAKEIFKHHKVEKLPIVDKNFKLQGLITLKDYRKVKMHPFASKDTEGRLRVGAAVGVGQETSDRVDALVAVGVDVIVVDSAHGHSKGVLATIRQIKKTYPQVDVIGGNIATVEGAKALVDAGADAVKVGIGPGSICTTRIVAGVGVPQFSAVLHVAEAVKGTGVSVIADGGIKQTGDVVKAIAAGADMVMLGSALAGTEESPGETIIYNGRKFKSYRGMGSIDAMQAGSADRYGQDKKTESKKLVPEGIVGRVPYKGSVQEVMYQYIGGLRSGMGYCGARDIASLQGAPFVQITAAGLKESHPHDVTITKEAPNYMTGE